MSLVLRNRLCRVIIVLVFELLLIGCSKHLTANAGYADTVSGYAVSPPSTSDHRADLPPVFNNHSSVAVRIPAGPNGENPPKEISYENTTLTEDVTWSGSVLVRGYLVIASQATVKIEPGTVVRFMKCPILRQMPRLVVMGRIDCHGLPGQPVRFLPDDAGAGNNPGWEGILLLSSEKRNNLEYVRIERATTAIEALFSNLKMTDAAVIGCRAAMLVRDSVIELSRVTVDSCDIALEAFDSELDIRDSTLVHNQKGISVVRSALGMQGVTLKDNGQRVISADDSRIRMISCEIAGNAGGVHLRGGEGQITGTRFVGNRGVGLDLVSSRVKISRSLFADTDGDAVRMDDGQSAIWESSFERNSGYNLVCKGSESVSAIRNWWGGGTERKIADKLFDGARNSRYGRISFFPWLPERPAL